MIASGSMVLENMKIPPRSLVMGNPARIRGEINERHVELIKLSSSTYVDKVKVYLDSEQFSWLTNYLLILYFQLSQLP